MMKKNNNLQLKLDKCTAMHIRYKNLQTATNLFDRNLFVKENENKNLCVYVSNNYKFL